MPSWTSRAIDELLRAVSNDPGWGYQPRTTPSVEPTALATLALSAHLQPPEIASEPTARVSPGRASETQRLLAQSRDGIARIQRPDGSVPPAPSVHETGWTTPYAILAWSTSSQYSPSIERAKNWLLAREGLSFVKPSDSPLGHDTTLTGWNWVEGTHSWVEPTAMAILALRRVGLAHHARVQQGLALILDRAIPEGGWNFGNNVVYGRSLRPKPAPTGLALLALAGLCERSDKIDRGIEYLLGRLPVVRSPQSLGLGVLALAAWDACPTEVEGWLEESFETLAPTMRTSDRLAYLLLANAPRSLPLLGSRALRESSS